MSTKRSYLWLLVTCILMLITYLAATQTSPVSADEKAAAATPKWEYWIYQIDFSSAVENNVKGMVKRYSEWGADGWEVCGVVNGVQNGGAQTETRTTSYVIFKRPKP